MIKNNILNLMNKKWAPIPALLFMVLSGIYLFLYVQAGSQIGYVWMPEHFGYWLVFPYNDTYYSFAFASVVFLGCGFIVTRSIRKPKFASIRTLAALGLSIFSVLAFCGLCSFVFLLTMFGNVYHVDSVQHGNHQYHLAYRNNFEYGPAYYLFECDRFAFRCEYVSSFSPHPVPIFVDDSRFAKLHISSDDMLTVDLKGTTIYEYHVPEQ